MPNITSERTGTTLNLPDDLSEEEQRFLIEKYMLSAPDISPRGVPKPIPTLEGQAAVEGRVSRTQSIETQLGGKLERTEEGRLAEFPTPLGTAFDIGRSRTTKEQAAKLKAKFPEITVKIVDDPEGGQIVGVQLPDQDTFTLLDSNEIASLADAAEVGGMVFNLETLGAILATVATRGRGLIARAGGQAAGGAAGRAADIGLEEVRGFGEIAAEEMAGELGVSAAVGALAEGVFAIPRRVANVALKRGAVKLTPEEMAAERTAQGIGPDAGLTLGDVVPIAKRIEAQARATSKVTQQNISRRLATHLKSLQTLVKVGEDFRGVNDRTLDDLVRRAEGDILGMINFGPTDAVKGGKALTAGRREYVKAAKAWIGRKYDRAIAAAEDAQWDLADSQKLAKELKKGISGLGKSGKGVRVSAKPGAELSAIINDLLKLDPAVRSFDNVTGFEQIKELRTRLFDLKNAAMPGQEDAQNRMAGQLWDSLSKAMDNPTGGGEDFVRLHRAAAIANRRKEAHLEIVDMRRIGSTAEPDAEALVNQVTRPTMPRL